VIQPQLIEISAVFVKGIVVPPRHNALNDHSCGRFIIRRISAKRFEMQYRFVLALVSFVLIAAAPVVSKEKPVRIQLAFMHFLKDQVRISVNGKVLYNKPLSVAPENKQSGIAGFAQIEMPHCADIVVQSKRQRFVQRLCLAANTKSLIIEAGPPIKLTQNPDFQGLD
jgi:hypothetical protein